MCVHFFSPHSSMFRFEAKKLAGEMVYTPISILIFDHDCIIFKAEQNEAGKKSKKLLIHLTSYRKCLQLS